MQKFQYSGATAQLTFLELGEDIYRTEKPSADDIPVCGPGSHHNVVAELQRLIRCGSFSANRTAIRALMLSVAQPTPKGTLSNPQAVLKVCLFFSASDEANRPGCARLNLRFNLATGSLELRSSHGTLETLPLMVSTRFARAA